MVDKLKRMVGSCAIKEEVEDRMVWIHDKGGGFKLKSCRICW